MKREERLRNQLLLTVLLLFGLLLVISGGAMLFLIKTNLVSLDHTRVLGDLRQVRMYLNLKAPGAWEIRSEHFYKGNVQITDNEALIAELTEYLLPESKIAFEIGTSPEVERAKLQRFDKLDPWTRFVVSSSRLDPRFRRMISGKNESVPMGPGSEAIGNGQGAEEAIYLTEDGLVASILSRTGEVLGWVWLHVRSIEKSLAEGWALRVSFIGLGGVSIVILVILYVILFRLSAPIVRMAESQTAIVRENEDLKGLTRSDPLTGILNRRGFENAMKELTQGWNGYPAGLAILDLDNFKGVNDAYGHSCGDFVLVHVAAMIRKCVRKQDLACRWGGEEFLVCYPDITIEVLEEATERLRASIAAFPIRYEGRQIPITVTIGTAVCRNQTHFARALESADAALYCGKRAGKNRVVSGDKLASSENARDQSGAKNRGF